MSLGPMHCKFTAKSLQPSGLILAEKQGVKCPRAVRYHYSEDGPSTYCWHAAICPVCRAPMGPLPFWYEAFRDEELFVFVCACDSVSLAALVIGEIGACDLYVTFAGTLADFGISRHADTMVLSVEAIDKIFCEGETRDATKN